MGKSISVSRYFQRRIVVMNLTADRQGNVVMEDSVQDRFLAWMYEHAAGRILLRPLISPVFSRAGGRLLDTGLSSVLIRPFIRAAGIDMSEYENRHYRSYNDFFTRKLVPGARRIDDSPESFISPCDSRLSVYRISGDSDSVIIKHTRYSLASLLRDRKLAAGYAGGYLWVFRLCVDDYHRYIYVDQGSVSQTRHIRGVFHTVNPVANDVYPVYKENTREYSLLKSDHFGKILQMEVGALLVGKIENQKHTGSVKRGQEKGNFAFGGSTIILMTEKDRVCPDEDILNHSKQGMETRVLLGECIGRKCTGN